MAKVSVIIPVFNEQENIKHLVDELNLFFRHEKKFLTEIIFVNDGSTDTTLNLLKNAEHQYYTPRIISFSRNFGSHAALRAGILKAKGDFITFLYADLQDPISLVSQLYDQALNKEVDIVWAFRSAAKVSTSEKLFSRTYASLMRRYAVPNFPKKGFDVVMFSKKVKDCLNNNIENNSSIFIQILNLGFKQSSITYNKRMRLAGKSKWTLSKKIKLLVNSFVAFSFAPIRLVSLTGVSFFVLGILWTSYIISRKVLYNDLASGWPALLSILMIGFGVTNISLGIIAEYLWRTLDASRKRPVFIIDEIVEEIELNKENEVLYQLK